MIVNINSCLGKIFKQNVESGVLRQNIKRQLNRPISCFIVNNSHGYC